MPLIKAGRLVDDSWRFLSDDEAAPSGAAIVVSLERWRREQDELIARPSPLGIRLAAGQHPGEIIAHLGRLALIALSFPKFTDGRAYSYARLLRERHGFRGELRAIGQVLRDQLLFMHRAGFDAFEIAKGDPLEAWCKACREFSVFYQMPPRGGSSTGDVRLRGRAPLPL
jgi:uncharacterized protein (DUF934 family)